MKHENRTTEGAWLAWREACAIDLCDEATAAELSDFGRFAFQAQIRKAASSIGHHDGTFKAAETGDAWHLLETHARAANTRAGKRYKDWLFQRAPRGKDWLDAVEAGAVLLMRAAVRELLRREYSPEFMTSLNRSVAQGRATLEDLLPDIVSVTGEVERAEWERLAEEYAARFAEELTDRAAAALWARSQGIALSDDRVLAMADCGSSVLYEAHRKSVERICDQIRSDFPDEDAAAQMHLVTLVLQKLTEEVCRNFFRKSDGLVALEKV